MLNPLSYLINIRNNSISGDSSYSPIVLMYHGTPDQQPSSEYSIKASLFSEHIRFLKNNGWNTFLFRDLFSHDEFPPKTVVICFDDGYADNYENAFVPLVDNGLKGTWFVTSSCIGGYARWEGRNCPETKILDKPQIISMSERGMEIASHTHTHPDLSKMDYESQLGEMKTSKSVLEDLLQQEVLSLAYPFGRFNDDSIKAADSSGYLGACTVRQGRYSPATAPFIIPRLTIFRDDTSSVLARKLALAENNVSNKRIIKYFFNRVASRLYGR